ncbi:MAG TPA: transcriptional regulator BetI [Dongiaceae bacterium]|nr:transcriptional regulator BetI [Dongiaceae bacterium]
MARQSIEQIRRAELTEAAWQALQQWGAAGTTLARVAELAGVSKGIVLHYFTSKDELMEAAMRRANAALRDEVARRLKLATSPRGRIEAVIEGNFAEGFFSPEICHAWLAFCAEVPRNRQYARLQRAIHARMHSNLMSGLRHLLPSTEAEATAYGITSLIDGLWLRLGLEQGGIDRDLARGQLYRYLEMTLANHAAKR